MTIEKQLEAEELMARIRRGAKKPRATASEEKTTIPELIRQRIQSFVDSLPPIKLPPLPPFLPVLVFPTSKSTAASEALKMRPPPAAEAKVSEEVIAPVEVEEATSPQRVNEHGFLF